MTTRTFRPKKSLGQYFLADENIARKIIQVVAPKPSDVFVEIGPGFGVLTKYLVAKTKRCIAVEIDRDLVAGLRAEYEAHGNLHILEADFLKVDLLNLVAGCDKVRVVGNIPYHITSPVIFKILNNRELVEDLTLMIQKEVARRVVAHPGNKEYGILSVFSQLYSKPRLAFTVSRNVFRPKPEVNSALVCWKFAAINRPDVADPALFNRIVHLVFQQRRKMLRRSLKTEPELAARLQSLDFDLQRRPESLSPEEFVALSNQLSE